MGILWATQRVDEIRGFADRVTLLNQGEVRFSGTVPQLMARSHARTYVVQVRPSTDGGGHVGEIRDAVRGLATVTIPHDHDGEHYVLSLAADAVLGRAIAALDAAGLSVVACREERSEIETAFLLLTGEES
jgi:ABC-type multidrug transport system ATPase subunit